MERVFKCMWMVLFTLMVASRSRSTANLGTFWHVTDFHYDPTVVAGGRGLSCNGPAKLSAPFGDYWCDSPWSLVQDSVDAMAQLHPDVDFIIWTGDTVGHIKDEDTSLTQNLEILQNITNILTAAYPNTPVYATLGNHDFYPTDQAKLKEDPFYTKVADMWAHWINDTDQVDLFRNGGYYSKILSDNLILIGMNTNVYYRNNWIVSKPGIEDPAGQMAWMAEKLTFARQTSRKAMLTGHVTIGLKAPGLFDNIYPAYRQPLVELLLNYSDVIVGSHLGHDHLDNFKVIQNEDGTKAITHFSAPSVTPWRSKDAGQPPAPAHNPALRLIKYDRDTGNPLDYDQYFMNLTDSNERGSANWTILYTFTEAYNVPNMSPSSLRTVFSRMSDNDGALAKQYCQYSLVSRFPQHCSPVQLAQIYCAGLYNDATLAENCVKKIASSGVRIMSSVMLAVLGLLACFLR